jgi:hypothetical protein
MMRRSLVGQGFLTVEASGRYDFSGRVISPSQRSVPDNTQQSQQTNIHAPGGTRTHSPSKQAAADPRLTPRGHWDRQRDYTNIKYWWVL